MKAVNALFGISLGVLVGALPLRGWARTLECPEGDALHHAEATATSAPEVKVRAGADIRATLKPLTQKALRLAREQRAAAMQRGIEEACPAPQVYVGEVAEYRSGCETRTITRPGDAGHEWVQVVAICKYDWTCCGPVAGKAASGPGITLQGPLAAQASTPTAPSGTRPAKK
jgi:hypothetical protein